MTILPYEGFIRRDRAFRPSAPTGELADSIRKGARHGLPEIRPTPVVAAPALAEGDSRKFRRIAAPPADIDRRGVVTRNPNSDSSLLGGHRERRTIAEGRGPAFNGGQTDQAGQDRHQDKEQRRQQQREQRKQQQQAGSTDSGGERHSQKIRVPLQNSSDSVNIDGGGRERKPNRDEDRSTANDASQRRQERATSRDSGGSASGGQQNDQGRQDRHQEKEQRREQQRQERHQEQQRQQQQQPSEYHQERQQQQAQQPEHHHHQEQQQQQQEQRRKQ
jgi:hypothetical protein